METKKITPEMRAMLDKPLPPEAIKKHPTKSYLSTINSIYVTERLNDVFGVGAWTLHTEEKDKMTTKGGNAMVVTYTTLEIPEYGVKLGHYGGNDNADLGDAYKGSVTDALTKIASMLGIGAHVWKNDPSGELTRKADPEERTKLIEAVKKAKSVKELTALWNKYITRYMNDNDVKAEFSERRKELENGK